MDQTRSSANYEERLKHHDYRRKKQCVFYVDIVKQNVYRISIRWAKICVPRADIQKMDQTRSSANYEERLKHHD
jgi:hypothetical protein